MAFHHALKLLDPVPRAALSFFMAQTYDLTLAHTDILSHISQQIRKARKTPGAKKAGLRDQLSFLESLIDGMHLSVSNQEAIYRYAEDFEMPAERDQESFVRTVDAIDRWRNDPEVKKAMGRQGGLLDHFYFSAITVAKTIDSYTTSLFSESQLIKYNYAFSVALSVVSMEVTGSRQFLENSDPTWHPLNVGRIAYPLADEKTIRQVCDRLNADEMTFLQAVLTDVQVQLDMKGENLETVRAALLERYPGPMVEAFVALCPILFEKIGKNGDTRTVTTLVSRLIRSGRLPDIILGLRRRMMFCESTPFIWALTSPLKLLAIVMNLYIDPDGDSIASGFLLPLLDPNAGEEEIREHYSQPAFYENVFDSLHESVPAELLAPTILTFDLLRPVLSPVFDPESREALEATLHAKLETLCPILAEPDRTAVASATGAAVGRFAEEFHAAHPGLVPDFNDKDAVRQMLLKLPEYFPYIEATPAKNPDQMPPGQVYRGFLLVWLFSIEVKPVLMKIADKEKDPDFYHTLDLLFSIITRMTAELGSAIAAQVDADTLQSLLQQIEEEKRQHVSGTEDQEEKPDRRKSRSRPVVLMDDDVPDGTVFN